MDAIQHKTQYHMFAELPRLLIHDGWFKGGLIGSIVMFLTNWFVEFMSPFVGLLAACGGLVVIIMTIWQKTVEIKIKSKELKELEEEERDRAKRHRY